MYNSKKYRKYYIKNRERKLRIRREYYQNNRDKIRKRAKELYPKHRDQNLKYLKRYRIEHPRKVRESRRRYAKKNRQYIIEHSHKYIKEIKKSKPLQYRCRLFISGIRQRGVKFDKTIDSKYFEDRITANPYCECCGKKFKFNFERRMDWAIPSVDRVDPRIGYIKNNIGIVCWGCNMTKSWSTPQQIRNILKYIKKYGK